MSTTSLKSYTTKRPKNIVFVHDTNTFGGLEIVVLELLRHLDTTRFHPFVMVPGFTEAGFASPPLFIEQVKSMDVPILQPTHPGHHPIFSRLRDIIYMAKLFRLAHTDIVHIHTAHVSGARKATISARLAGIPVVLRTEHNSPTAFSSVSTTNYMTKLFDLFTNRIITVSEHDRWEQIHYFGRTPNKVYRSYNGVDITKFDLIHNTSNAKKELGFDPDTLLIGTVGRFTKQKGHRYFIEAAAKVLHNHPQTHFMLVGNGELEPQLRAQADALDITDNVHFVGYQSDPIPFIKAMDIAAMSSLHEGFSLSLLEFMALGKPTVVTNHPGLVEASINGVTGVVVERGSGIALAEGINYLLDNPDLARRMGHAARTRVETNFTFKRYVDDMMSLYN